MLQVRLGFEQATAVLSDQDWVAGLSTDLGLSSSQYQVALVVFFVGYVKVVQMPLYYTDCVISGIS